MPTLFLFLSCSLFSRLQIPTEEKQRNTNIFRPVAENHREKKFNLIQFLPSPQSFFINQSSLVFTSVPLMDNGTVRHALKKLNTSKYIDEFIDCLLIRR